LSDEFSCVQNCESKFEVWNEKKNDQNVTEK
jgi:hypothetical protein